MEMFSENFWRLDEEFVNSSHLLTALFQKSMMLNMQEGFGLAVNVHE